MCPLQWDSDLSNAENWEDGLLESHLQNGHKFGLDTTVYRVQKSTVLPRNKIDARKVDSQGPV